MDNEEPLPRPLPFAGSGGRGEGAIATLGRTPNIATLPHFPFPLPPLPARGGAGGEVFRYPFTLL